MNASATANVSPSRWSTPPAHIPSRLLMALALAAVVASFGALSLAGSFGGQSGQSSVAQTHRGWDAAPLAARVAVSSGLGAHNPSYWMHRGSGSGISVMNPEQHLSASLSAGAVQVRGGGGVQVGLAAATVGRGAVQTALGRGVLTGSARNRATFAASGVQERYINGPYGLEQSFVVSRRPGGTSGELVLSQVITGNARAKLETGADGVNFTSAHGSLQYSGLMAVDARGRRLAARFTLHGDRLGIAVEDRGAAYPVTIDPNFEQVAELSDSSSSYLGYSGLAISDSGDTIVAGDLGNHLWVYTKPNGGWTTTMTPTAELSYSPATNYLTTVGISGDGNTIVAGDDQENSSQGALFVFTKSASSAWSSSVSTVELTASDGAAYDYLGASVAVSEDGSTIAAGASGYSSNQGTVYVFTRPNTGWATTSTYAAQLTPSNGASGDDLGDSIAMDQNADTIVAGAPKADTNGAAYVWKIPNTGWATTSTYAAELTGATTDGDAYQVAISGTTGDTIAVGAGYVDTDRGDHAGVVYVYTVADDDWATTDTPTAELTASDGVADQSLGYEQVAVSDSGDTVFAGSYNDDTEYPVYVWTEPAGGWTSETQSEELAEPAGAGEDDWGLTLAVGGNTSVLSDPYANGYEGALYVYDPFEPPTSNPTSHDFGTQALDTYGAPASFTITNPNREVLPDASFTTAGADPDDFLVSSSTCSTIAASGTCSVHVRFGPTASGARSATLVESDGENTGSTVVATLTGTGGSLPQGATGATGPTGKTGAAGKNGKNGKNGKVELVTCTVKGKHKKCKTKLVSKPVKFTTAAVRATLSRHGVVYASGNATIRNGVRRLTLHASHSLRAGRYTLTLIYRSGRRIRTTIRIA